MYTLLLVVHSIIVISLIAIILIQRGRSGGLVEALGGVESIFGTKTSGLLVKITVTLAVLFFFSSIFLAYISKQRSESLLKRVKIPKESQQVREDTLQVPEDISVNQDTTAEPAPSVNENAE